MKRHGVVSNLVFLALLLSLLILQNIIAQRQRWRCRMYSQLRDCINLSMETHLPAQQVVAGVAVQVTDEMEACRHTAAMMVCSYFCGGCHAVMTTSTRHINAGRLTGGHDALLYPSLDAVRDGIEQECLSGPGVEALHGTTKMIIASRHGRCSAREAEFLPSARSLTLESRSPWSARCAAQMLQQ